MFAIVSLLDRQNYLRLEDLWHQLEVECGLAGVNLTPLPHFSWHIASEYNFEALEAALAVLAGAAQPFTVHTSGLGVFTGTSPVIYLPLVKNLPLADFHQRVWAAADPLATNPTSHYAPDVWVPHITLAYGDVTPPRLGCAMEKVAFQPFNWEVQVDHLALVYQMSEQVGRLQSRYEFGGKGNQA